MATEKRFIDFEFKIMILPKSKYNLIIIVSETFAIVYRSERE